MGTIALGRHIVPGIPARLGCRTGSGRQKPGLCAVERGDHFAVHRELLYFLIRQILRHDILPDPRSIACTSQAGRGLVARPDPGNSIGCTADKPAVVIVIRSTRLTENLPAGDCSSAAGSLCTVNNGAQDTLHNGRCRRADRRYGILIAVIQNHISVMIHHVIVGVWLVVFSAVAKNLER